LIWCHQGFKEEDCQALFLPAVGDFRAISPWLFGGFFYLKGESLNPMGVAPVIHLQIGFSWIFRYHPSSYWGIPIDGNLQMSKLQQPGDFQLVG